jgi:hypothetical protein
MMKTKVFIGASIVAAVFFYACGSQKKIAEGTPVFNKNMQERGYVLYEATQKLSEQGCGFLLRNLEADELTLVFPITPIKELEKEGQKAWIMANPSRIKQDKCFNARPVSVDSLVLLK